MTEITSGTTPEKLPKSAKENMNIKARRVVAAFMSEIGITDDDMVRYLPAIGHQDFLNYLPGAMDAYMDWINGTRQGNWKEDPRALMFTGYCLLIQKKSAV